MGDRLPDLDFDLDFGTIADQIDTLSIAVPNELEREWPPQWSHLTAAPVILRSLVLVARNTYRTIGFLCADAQPPQFAVSVPPLVRELLDVLFTIVFLFDDLPTKTEWFLKSGWRELYERHARYQDAYASVPAWADWLKQFANCISALGEDWSIPQAETAHPASIPRWPHPGRMIHKNTALTPDRHSYLTYLNDWFYRELSSATHLSWPGMAERARFFLRSDQERAQRLQKYRSDCFARTITLFLAALSEVQIECRYDLAQRLKYVWGVLAAFSAEAKELYDLRYASRL